MQVAPLQRNLLDFLRTNLKQLESVAGEHSLQELKSLNARLDDWAARVAVIGQVKAGKSTFLNAFLGRHDLLPSDINPWTSVITNMRINVTGDPETGAEFHFFNEENWDEMLEGSDKVREMAEEMLPGFDTELLKQQSQAVKEQAERRLGEHYRAMLGKKHEHDFVSPDLLRRYVCAGPGSDDGLTREAQGRYAALTREANIFMRSEDFLVPTIVMDTPGVNDPFLVRDEVTCRSLDKSDVFVMVLSAHQALTDVDLGLIRILAKQDGKDVLIFINRMDELEGYDTRYEKVVDDVTKRLEAAIPDIEFKVIVGSGYMADAAIREDEVGEAIREELDTETLAAYLQARYGKVPESREERLMLGSGLDEIRRGLSMMIDGGIGCNQLSRFTYDMFAQIEAMSLHLKGDRTALRDVLAKAKDGGFESVIAALGDEIAKLVEVCSSVDSAVETAKGDVDELAGKALTSLERDLNAQFQMFIAEKGTTLADSILRENASKTKSKDFEIDLTPLHDKLENVIRSRYTSTRRYIDTSLGNCMDVCRSRIEKHFGEDVERLTLDDLPNLTFTTTLSMSKKTVQGRVINHKSLAFWRTKMVDTKATVRAMCMLAGEELRPTIAKLLESFSEAQNERIAAGIERIALMQRMLEAAREERTRALEDDREKLVNAAGEGSGEEVIADLQRKIDDLEQKLQELEAFNLTMSEAPVLQAA